MKKVQDEYKLDRTMEFPNAVVRVYRPVLDESERERRMKRLMKATAEIMKEAIDAERSA